METPNSPTEVDYNKKQKISLWIPIAMIVVALFGFSDATYLTAKHYQGEIPYCGEERQCEAVLTSEYATVANIPVALPGAFFYLSVLVLALVYLDTQKAFVLKIIPCLTVIGLLASAWFVYLMYFVIEQICLYCLGSAASSTTLFFLGVVMYMKTSKGV